MIKRTGGTCLMKGPPKNDIKWEIVKALSVEIPTTPTTSSDDPRVGNQRQTEGAFLEPSLGQKGSSLHQDITDKDQRSAPDDT
eukprot:2216378-Amphidinium_carterae.1